MKLTCEDKPVKAPILNKVLTRYPACTRPALPVDAAQIKATAKATRGMAYIQVYSGGSEGLLNKSSMRFVIKKPPKMSTQSSFSYISNRKISHRR